MKKYFNIKSDLVSCESKFIDDGTVKSVKLEIKDSLSIDKIKKEKIILIYYLKLIKKLKKYLCYCYKNFNY